LDLEVLKIQQFAQCSIHKKQDIQVTGYRNKERAVFQQELLHRSTSLAVFKTFSAVSKLNVRPLSLLNED
jgi:hypothetical protein